MNNFYKLSDLTTEIIKHLYSDDFWGGNLKSNTTEYDVKNKLVIFTYDKDKYYIDPANGLILTEEQYKLNTFNTDIKELLS